MSDEQELKLACLHHAGGNLDHAKSLFDWVSGSVRATPQSEAPAVSAPNQDKPEQPFNYQHPSKYGTDVPRRCYLEELTPEEREIRDLVGAIEHLGAHPLLTTTVIQLMKAGESLADWVDIGLRDKAIAALSTDPERPSVVADLDRADHNPPNDTEGGGEAVQIPEGFVRLSEPTDSVEAIANLRREVKSDNFLMFTERGQIVRPCIGNAGINETVDGFMHEGGRIIAYHYELPKKLYTFEEALIDERGYVDFSKPRADLERTEVDSPAQASTEQEPKDEGAPVLDAGPPSIPRSEIPEGAAVETFVDTGVETVKIGGITHIVEDTTEPFKAEVHGGYGGLFAKKMGFVDA